VVSARESPDVRPQRYTSSSDNKADLADYAKRKERAKKFKEKIEQKGMAPVGSLMKAEVERRMVVFRSCFAHSIYEARRLVMHGDVYLNGKKVSMLSVPITVVCYTDMSSIAHQRQYTPRTRRHDHS
jgi:ribosomal protein S4